MFIVGRVRQEITVNTLVVFINISSCQFIVKASGDYRRYVNDPDALVDWDFVEQIVGIRSVVIEHDLNHRLF